MPPSMASVTVPMGYCAFAARTGLGPWRGEDVDFLVENQFGGQIVRIKETKLLCVPSGELPVD